VLFNDGRPLFFGVTELVLTGAAAAAVGFVLAARGGNFANRLGRAVAAVSAIGLRTLLDGRSPSAAAEGRFLGGIAKSQATEALVDREIEVVGYRRMLRA
jgi:hypothetical protein